MTRTAAIRALGEVQATTPTQLVDVLRCAACGHDGLEPRSASLRCPVCERQYGIEHGVVDLEPPVNQDDRSVAQRVMESRFYARFYEERAMPAEVALVSKYLQLGKAHAVLDVSCGTGSSTRNFASELRREGSDALLVGSDVSWVMLETARGYVRSEGLEDSLHLLRAHATKFPLRSSSFDRLYCGGALHLMEDVDGALAEFSRVLEPGGICVVRTFVTRRGVVDRALKRLAEIPSGFHWFGPDELPGRMAAHGLAVYAESVQGDALTVAARRVQR